MPMETARGIIQIESGKNYYWRATRPEPAHSARSHLRIRGGKEESRERERERSKRLRRRGSRVVEKREGGVEGDDEGGRGGGRRNGRESEEVR